MKDTTPPDGEGKKKHRKTSAKKVSRILPKPPITEAPKSAVVPSEIHAPLPPVVEEAIKQALTEFHRAGKVENAQLRDVRHLDSLVREYMKCYLMVGYDLHEEKVFLMYAPNTQDKDALLEHLRGTFLSFVNDRYGGGQEG